MGLCKCPKKKVTNLFCFEHRVNVCEHCLVVDHSRCVVQSYLQWLKDSDYNPICQICNHRLQDGDNGECVRLLCYDVFHWDCINSLALSMPANTAPAGYECPACHKGIIPRPNHAGPVAEALKTRLVEATWAREGLGLPSKDQQQTGTSEAVRPPKNMSPMRAVALPAGAAATSTPMGGGAAGVPNLNATSSVPDHSVLSIPYDSSVAFQSGARKTNDMSNGSGHMNGSVDYDEDKYKRRPALSWLARWFQSYMPAGKPMSRRRRFLTYFILALLVFMAVVVVMAHLTHASEDDSETDPLLDPKFNPNLQMQPVQ